MWGLLIKVQQTIQRIRPLRVQYSLEKGGFYENHSFARQICSAVIDTNVVLIWMAALVGVKRAITDNDTTKSVQEQVLGMVLQILFFGLFSLFLAAVWTFQFKGNFTVWMMTTAKSLHDKRQAERDSMKEPPRSGRRELGLFDFLLYGVVTICLFGCIIISFTPLLSSHTPAHKLLHAVIPHNIIEKWSKPFITLICCVYLGIFGSLAIVPTLQVFLCMCGFLCESKYIMQPTYDPEKMDLRRRTNFSLNKLIYMQSFLYSYQYNIFGYVWFPMVMTTGFVVNVMTSLICIEFNSDLHPLLVAFFAGFDLVCAGLTVGIHSFAMISSEEADKFHKFWKVRLFTKFQRKDYQACMPITCEIGPFFVLKRSTFLNTTSEIVKTIVSLLIMEE